MVRLQVYSKEDCSLCVKAIEVARRVCEEWGVAIEVIDIRGSPALYEKFKELIPVIAIDGRPEFFHRVEEDALRSRLGLAVGV